MRSEGWWRDAVLYHVYVRSFADSDGDGVGDLPGLTSRLDQLAWLGVDALWLSPVGRSPNDDWGYDVSSYDGVDPSLGTDGDLEALIRAAGEHGIRIVLDLVPNHTSSRHPWFADPAKRDWYVWADPAADGGPPNNWQSIFGGPAWSLDDASGRYYLHNFLESMPDLNWWNDEVRAEFERILRRWFDLGVAGVRIDVAHALIHDRELRDNPPPRPADGDTAHRLGQFMAYNMNRPEVLEIYRRWRDLAREYDPERLLLGETYVVDLVRLATFYRDGDGLQLAMNFAFVDADLPELPGVVAETEARLPEGAWPVWLGSSHDHVRFPTRWAQEDEGLSRAALTALLTLRGTPILYQGDELLLRQAVVPRERLLDPVGVRFWPELPGRDGSRTPLPWEPGEGRGFTRPGVEPWLPFSDDGRTVAGQRDDPASALRLCRDLLALRRREADLREGVYEQLDAPPDVWAYRRGDRHAVALNLGAEPARVALAGRTVVATDRHGEGDTFDGELAPARGVVLTLDG